MKSPFKFLDSYTSSDREIFFGREKEISELYSKVFESKILLVYGLSGTGKSSLIHCGLAGKFNESDWLPVVVRRGKDITESMASEIVQLAHTQLKKVPQTPEQFVKAARSVYLDLYKPIYFIFDQFEELFIFGSPDEQNNFIAILKSLISSDLQCRFIFILREEYLANLSGFEKQIQGFFSNRIRIEKMSHENAIQTIEGPCKIAQINLEESFAASLVEKLCPNDSDVELTYLQVFLDKIFRLASSDVLPSSLPSPPSLTFSNQLLNVAGNVTDILGDFLDDQISMMEDPELAMAVLKAFVSAKGTRQAMDIEGVNDYIKTIGKNAEKESVLLILQSFVKLRILHEKDQHEKYELRHDALAAKIYEKFTVSEKELLEIRQFLENAFNSFEARGRLLNKEDLEYVNPYESRLILPQNINAFVIDSRLTLNNRKKSLLRVIRISAIIFILLLVAVLRTYLKSEKESDFQELAARALFISHLDPLQGLPSVLSVWSRDSTSIELRYLILNDFMRLLAKPSDSIAHLSFLKKQFEPFKISANILKCRLSRNGEYLFGWTDRQSAFIWKYYSDTFYYIKADDELVAMEISEDLPLVAMVYKNNKGIVCDYNGLKKFDFDVTTNDLMNESLVKFLPGKNLRLLSIKDSSVIIYNLDGKISGTLKAHSARVNSIDVSKDGAFITSAASDRVINLWRYSEAKAEYTLYNQLKGHKDTVWSCQFNKTGKYIISSSADSTIRIWNFSGEEINPDFRFAINNSGNPRVKTNKGEFDEDASNHDYTAYYRKFCNASFSKDEMVIQATGYQWVASPSGNRRHKTNQVLFFDMQSKLIQGFNAMYLWAEHEEFQSTKSGIMDEMVVSPDGTISAMVDDTKEITLFTAWGLCLARFTGENAIFSPTGDELIWTQHNEIHHLPITASRIKRIIEMNRDSINSNSLQKIFTPF